VLCPPNFELALMPLLTRVEACYVTH